MPVKHLKKSKVRLGQDFSFTEIIKVRLKSCSFAMQYTRLNAIYRERQQQLKDGVDRLKENANKADS